MLLRHSLISVALLALLQFLPYAEALDPDEAISILNKNCSSYLSEPDYNSSGDLMCPPWYVSEGRRCNPGLHVHYVVYFMQATGQPWLQTFFCMTTSPDEKSIKKRDVIGSCLFSFDFKRYRSFSAYYPLPCNVSRLNEYTCAGLNREGQLCGRCEKGFAPPVFSYSLSCVNCTDYHLNWLKYIGVAFGPLTIFCLLICFFHISATSPYLHGIVFYSQIITAPTIVRMLGNTGGYKERFTKTKKLEALYVSLLSFWNLDIFRAFYEPFCLHPNMTVVQALALDYLIAVYPLMLLLVALVLVSLHSRGNAIAVALWKPFGKILKPFVHHLNIQASLIKSIATLYFLSAMKVQSVSLDLLSPTPLYYVDNTVSDNLYLFLAGDVEYFGENHFPCAILALIFLVTFTLLPVLLLFLYPCSFFQKFLNRINCNSTKLRIFMDVYQGNYKDGTNNTRDYRFFSGIFFISRFAIVANYILLNSLFSMMIFGAIIVTLALSVALFHPQSTRLHYVLDSTTLILLSVLLFAAMGNFLTPSSIITWHVSSTINTLAVALPILYIIILAGYWVAVRKKILQRVTGCLQRKATKCNRLFSSSSEAQRLLACTD